MKTLQFMLECDDLGGFLTPSANGSFTYRWRSIKDAEAAYMLLLEKYPSARLVINGDVIERLP